MKLILKAIRNIIDGVYNYVDNIIAKATNVAYVYTELIKEQTVAIDVGSSEGYDYEILDGNLYLEQGKVYAVTLNGKTYTCTAWYLEYWDSVCLGNGSVIGQEGGDDAPFLIDSYDDGNIYLEVASSGEYTISISSVEEGTRTLDKKYLPEDAKSDWNQNDPTAPDYVKNRPFWTGDPVDTVLFEGTVVNDDAPEIELIVGQEYTVTLDSVEYVCTAWDDIDGSTVIGSESLWWGNDYVDTEPPFAIGVWVDDGSWFYTINEGEEHTLLVVGHLVEINKIDEKYLPSTVLMSSTIYPQCLANCFLINKHPKIHLGYLPNVAVDPVISENVTLETWKEFVAMMMDDRYMKFWGTNVCSDIQFSLLGDIATELDVNKVSFDVNITLDNIDGIVMSVRKMGCVYSETSQTVEFLCYSENNVIFNTVNSTTTYENHQR